MTTFRFLCLVDSNLPLYYETRFSIARFRQQLLSPMLYFSWFACSCGLIDSFPCRALEGLRRHTFLHIHGPFQVPFPVYLHSAIFSMERLLESCETEAMTIPVVT